jgi:pyrroloquinoline quinone (PQQ) biosynthesis protein C
VFVLNPALVMEDKEQGFCLEDHSVKLTFHGDSIELCRRILPEIDRCRDIDQLTNVSGYSPATLRKFIALLEEDGLLLNLSYLDGMPEQRLVAKIRLAATFWNKHVMAQPFPGRLFRGEATREEVLGWGIEFYFFIRAANEYMARGSSRVNGPTSVLSSLWKHYAEEALHAEIFLKGLTGCGIGREDIINRPPLASTLGLLNYLYETSEEGILEYAAIFAVMQPLARPSSTAEIASRYEFLSRCYPFARSLFYAFEQHDSIDSSLGHSKLALEPILAEVGSLDSHTIAKLFSIIESTSNHFILFFEGIPRHYRSSRSVTYRQVPNALAALLC